MMSVIIFLNAWINTKALYCSVPVQSCVTLQKNFNRFRCVFTCKTSNTKNRLVFRKPNIRRQLGPSDRRLIISRAKLPGGAGPTLALCR